MAEETTATAAPTAEPKAAAPVPPVDNSYKVNFGVFGVIGLVFVIVMGIMFLDMVKLM